jgi:hypothetical protein
MKVSDANRTAAALRAAQLWRGHPDWTYTRIGTQLAREGIVNSVGNPYQTTGVKALLWDHFTPAIRRAPDRQSAAPLAVSPLARVLRLLWR